MTDPDPLNLLAHHVAARKRRGDRVVRLTPEGRKAMAAIKPGARPVRAEAAGTPAARPAPAPLAPEAGLVPAGLSKREGIEHLRARVLPCAKCGHLAASRTQVVFGVGDPEARLMFVGEAPGAEEDEQGEPFVGKAGQLLTKMIEAMGLARGQVYIANILKCRPDMPKGASGNRKPTLEEIAMCLPYLKAQIAIIRPEVMVALGATAVQGLLNDATPIGRLRGTWLDFEGIPLMPTYHPAYLLRNQSLSERRRVWEDLLQAMERLGLEISEKQRGFFLKK